MLLLHLAGVVVWVGGMFFAHFFLRPAATELLPPLRLQLMHAVLTRFFASVAASIILILVSGFAIMASIGFVQAPLHWHVMMGLGLLMTVIFSIIYFQPYSRFKTAVAAQDWPTAGAAMNRVRILVATNLAFGVVTIVVATLGVYLDR